MSRKQPPAMTPSPLESPDYVQPRQNLDGRMEKRLPIIMVVRLFPVERVLTSGEELTYTDNVSANGVRVFSKTSWKPGEQVQVTAVKEKSSMRGEVIYCQRLDNDHYCVGLKYLETPVKWFTIHRFHGK
jgi:PilZ domain